MIHKSVLKRERQSLVRRVRNRVYKSKIHTSFLKLMEAVSAKNKENVDGLLSQYFSNVDKAVKKGLIKKNNGARKKSRIVKTIKATFTA